jgi:hypothetical protein
LAPTSTTEFICIACIIVCVIPHSVPQSVSWSSKVQSFKGRPFVIKG